MSDENDMEANKKILVVDDIEENIAILDRILTEADFQVIAAGDGEEAIDIVQRERPDMVLLDVNIPKMDGFKACKKLREDQLNDFMYIIMLTIKDELGDVCQALNAGADEYFFKNESKKKLLRRIRRLLSRPRSRDRLFPGFLS